jgi:hypothetical protein
LEIHVRDGRSEKNLSNSGELRRGTHSVDEQ